MSLRFGAIVSTTVTSRLLRRDQWLRSRVSAYRCLCLCDRVLNLTIVADVCVDPRMACRARRVSVMAAVREYLVQRRGRFDVPTALVLATCVAGPARSTD